MNEQLTFPTSPKKICGTCTMFEYIGCWTKKEEPYGLPWGKCYKNRMPGNHFDAVGAYTACGDDSCWEHDIQTEARMLVKEMKRKGIEMPELERLIVMVDK